MHPGGRLRSPTATRQAITRRGRSDGRYGTARSTPGQPDADDQQPDRPTRNGSTLVSTGSAWVATVASTVRPPMTTPLQPATRPRKRVVRKAAPGEGQEHAEGQEREHEGGAVHVGQHARHRGRELGVVELAGHHRHGRRHLDREQEDPEAAGGTGQPGRGPPRCRSACTSQARNSTNARKPRISMVKPMASRRWASWRSRPGPWRRRGAGRCCCRWGLVADQDQQDVRRTAPGPDPVSERGGLRHGVRSDLGPAVRSFPRRSPTRLSRRLGSGVPWGLSPGFTRGGAC